MADQWKVQVFGERCGGSWEISVVRLDNEHGRRSWGWFDDRKLLVSHNGGPCHWPIVGFVWDRHIATANDLCRRLNSGESVQTGMACCGGGPQWGHALDCPKCPD